MLVDRVGKLVVLNLIVVLCLVSSVSYLIAEESDGLPALEKQGGVVMTFDDRNFDDWVKAMPLFDEYGVKATFFINGKIDERALTAIRTLKSHGHAIGSHSVNHLKGVEYYQKRSLEKYVQNEISPQLEQFKAAKIPLTSFAYPMSRNDEVLDKALLKYFRHIRTGKGLAEGKQICDEDAYFVPVEKIAMQGCLYGKGIDYAPTLPDRTYDQINAALKRAAEKNEIIVFYAHRIARSGKGHHITPEALRRLFSKANELKLNFYTFDELP